MWQNLAYPNKHGSEQFKKDISKFWPGLSIQLVTKYLPNSVDTAK